jgi:hypothetical protein
MPEFDDTNTDKATLATLQKLFLKRDIVQINIDVLRQAVVVFTVQHSKNQLFN